MSAPQTVNKVSSSLDPHEVQTEQIEPPKVNCGRMKITFADGVCEIFDMASLNELRYFAALESHAFVENAKSELKLDSCNFALFKVIFALICEKKPVCEAMPEALLEAPSLFEELSAALSFFHPVDEHDEQDKKEVLSQKALIESIKTSLPHLLTLEAAEKFVGFQAKLEPYLVAVAKNKILQSKCFATREAAVECFESMRDAQVQKELACNHKARLEASLAKLPTIAHTARIQRALDDQNTIITEQDEALKVLLQNLPKMTGGLDGVSLSMLQRLAACKNDEREFVRKCATACENELEAYSEPILAALKDQRADLTRKDLLEYLIGPKAFLLDHYGLKTERGLFIRNGARYHYTLENASAFDLENEIRNEVQYDGPLPERIVKERAEKAMPDRIRNEREQAT